MILAVDDAEENLLILEAILSDASYHVQTALSGPIAIETALKETPQLVLLDISMPGMDGFEVCQKFKSTESLSDIPIIFISSHTETEEKVKGLTLGGVDYITKPFDPDEVIARVSTHLELQRLRKELEQSYSDLQQLEELRDNLVHMMVHDMRNQLSTQQFSLELLKGEDLGDQAKTDIEDALSSNAHLVTMANDLLAISRLESGKMPITKVETALPELCGDAVHDFEKIAAAKSITLQLQIDNIKVDCDTEVISRVITNLLHNALKFAPDEGSITVTGSNDAEGTLISVIDTGPGIPEEHVNSIFDKFGQSRESRKYTASGLGLTFCRLAIEAHGGKIGVESAPGQGSCFWFRLE